MTRSRIAISMWVLVSCVPSSAFTPLSIRCLSTNGWSQQSPSFVITREESGSYLPSATALFNAKKINIQDAEFSYETDTNNEDQSEAVASSFPPLEVVEENVRSSHFFAKPPQKKNRSPSPPVMDVTNAIVGEPVSEASILDEVAAIEEPPDSENLEMEFFAGPKFMKPSPEVAQVNVAETSAPIPVIDDAAPLEDVPTLDPAEDSALEVDEPVSEAMMEVVLLEPTMEAAEPQVEESISEPVLTVSEPQVEKPIKMETVGTQLEEPVVECAEPQIEDRLPETLIEVAEPQVVEEPLEISEVVAEEVAPPTAMQFDELEIEEPLPEPNEPIVDEPLPESIMEVAEATSEALAEEVVPPTAMEFDDAEPNEAIVEEPLPESVMEVASFEEPVMEAAEPFAEPVVETSRIEESLPEPVMALEDLRMDTSKPEPEFSVPDLAKSGKEPDPWIRSANIQEPLPRPSREIKPIVTSTKSRFQLRKMAPVVEAVKVEDVLPPPVSNVIKTRVKKVVTDAFSKEAPGPKKEEPPPPPVLNAVSTNSKNPFAESLAKTIVPPAEEQPVLQHAGEPNNMDRITKLWWQGTRYKESAPTVGPVLAESMKEFAPGVRLSTTTAFLPADPTEPFKFKDSRIQPPEPKHIHPLYPGYVEKIRE